MRRAWLLLIAACCPPDAAKPVSSPKPVEPTPAVEVAPPGPPAGPPVARTVDVVDRAHGIVAPDPYRWMETDKAELDRWMRAHSDHARKQLASLPGRTPLLARVRELGLESSEVFGVQVANRVTIYSAVKPGAQLPSLVVRENGGERVLLDPAKLGSAGQPVAINSYTLSPDGKHVGYVTSSGGSEVGAIRVVEVATGKDLPDRTDSIWGEFPPSWLPDGKSYFYTQMVPPPAGGDALAGMIVRHHRLGETSDKDVTIIGRDAGTTFAMAPEEFPFVQVQPGTGWMIARGAGARSEMRLAIAKLADLDRKGGKTPWKLVAGYADGVENAVVRGDRLYLQTYKDAPNRRIVSVPLAAPDLAKARVEIAEDPDASIGWITAARDAIYVAHDVGGRGKLSRWTWGGKPAAIELPFEGWTGNGSATLLADGLVFSIEDRLRPRAYYHVDPRGKVVSAGFGASSSADVSKLAVTRVEVAHDNVKVPLTILHAKDVVLDGSHPTIVFGYGAYGNSMRARFDATRIAWLERGGVFAIAGVRGGGERGRRWQDAGSREHKLNGIRDLIACAEYLIEKRYTSRGKIAAQGGSAGGILVGRAITERPEVFAAAHIAVGVVNPLRMLAADNGANQIGELGDPRTEAGYRWIHAMDPYQHVKPAAYPAVLFTVGLNDKRVAPWMSAKMAARLQSASTSKQPIWIRTDGEAGHGVGSTQDQEFEETADVWSFLLRTFGDPAFAPGA